MWEAIDHCGAASGNSDLKAGHDRHAYPIAFSSYCAVLSPSFGPRALIRMMDLLVEMQSLVAHSARHRGAELASFSSFICRLLIMVSISLLNMLLLAGSNVTRDATVDAAPSLRTWHGGHFWHGGAKELVDRHSLRKPCGYEHKVNKSLQAELKPLVDHYHALLSTGTSPSQHKRKVR